MPATALLTPLMLVTAAPAVHFDAPVYNHQTQVSVGVQLAQYSTASCYSTHTFNGTQTYGWNGQPSDSDADSDQRGDC